MNRLVFVPVTAVLVLLGTPTFAAQLTTQPTTPPLLQAAAFYRGKPRPLTWLNDQYAVYRNKLVCLNGITIDLQPHPPEGAMVFDRTQPARVHRCRYKTTEAPEFLELDCRVTQILSSQSFLATYEIGDYDSRTIHVQGLDASRLTDGDHLHLTRMLPAARFQYITVLGAKSTVRSIKPAPPITLEQFRAALETGFELIEWSHRQIRCPDCHGRGRVKTKVHVSKRPSGLSGANIILRQPVHEPCATCRGKGRVVAWYKNLVR